MRRRTTLVSTRFVPMTPTGPISERRPGNASSVAEAVYATLFQLEADEHVGIGIAAVL